MNTEKSFINVDTGEIVTSLPSVPCVDYVDIKSYNKLTYHKRRKRDLISRLLLHHRFSPDKGYFLTLTYDPLCLPTGSHDEIQAQIKDDFVKFVKRLRRLVGYHYGKCDLYYFAAVERGEQKDRLHLHMLLWNCPVEFLSYMARSDSFGNNIWNKGFVQFKEINPKRVYYVCKYVFKQDGFKYFISHGVGFFPDRIRKLCYQTKDSFFRCGRRFYKISRFLLLKSFRIGKVAHLSPNRYDFWKSINLPRFSPYKGDDFETACVVNGNLFKMIPMYMWRQYQYQIQCNNYVDTCCNR